MGRTFCVVLVVVSCTAVAVPAANAGTRNLRPIAFDGTALQTAFDAITVSGPGIDVYNDQTPLFSFHQRCERGRRGNLRHRACRLLRNQPVRDLRRR